MTDKKKRARRKPKKAQPVLILRVPPAGSVERHQFGAKIREALRQGSQSPPDGSASDSATGR